MNRQVLLDGTVFSKKQVPRIENEFTPLKHVWQKWTLAVVTLIAIVGLLIFAHKITPTLPPTFARWVSLGTIAITGIVILLMVSEYYPWVRQLRARNKETYWLGFMHIPTSKGVCHRSSICASVPGSLPEAMFAGEVRTLEHGQKWRHLPRLEVWIPLSRTATRVPFVRAWNEQEGTSLARSEPDWIIHGLEYDVDGSTGSGLLEIADGERIFVRDAWDLLALSSRFFPLLIQQGEKQCWRVILELLHDRVEQLSTESHRLHERVQRQEEELAQLRPLLPMEDVRQVACETIEKLRGMLKAPPLDQCEDDIRMKETRVVVIRRLLALVRIYKRATGKTLLSSDEMRALQREADFQIRRDE